MKNKNLVTALVVFGACSSGAFAQVFTYTPGELILAIRPDTTVSTSTTELIFDLGRVSTLSSYAPSTTTEIVKAAANQTGATIASTIQAKYGSSPSGLLISLFSADVNGNGLFYQSTPAGHAAPQVQDSVTQNNAVLPVNTFGGKLRSNSSLSASQKSNAGITTGVGYLTYNESKVASASAYVSTLLTKGNFYPGTQKTIEAAYDSTVGSTDLNFYKLDSQFNGSAASYLGTFTLDSNSRLYFTSPAASAVPEPRSYAFMAGLALAGFAAWRRRSSK